MLLANNIRFNRNNINILKNISLSISSKKIIHLKGDNGIGKTTLLKILTNILKPEQGEIFWNGQNINKNPTKYYKDLTFIMDRKTSNEYLSVKENILFWHKLCSSKIKKREIESILSLLSLDQYTDTPVGNLSYGEVKKLELSRLIIEQKKLWILDEPYIGLDNLSMDLVTQTITNHIKLGGMLIFTSHFSPKINNMETFEL